LKSMSRHQHMLDEPSSWCFQRSHPGNNKASQDSTSLDLG
jgi:hypothetical protein